MPDAIDPQLDEIRRRARRRLVGAVVLALAAAVLVPMLLESDPKPLGEDVSVKIPPVDDGKFVSKLGDKSRAEAPPPVKPATPATGSGAVPTEAAAPKDAVKDAGRDAAKESPGPTAVAPKPSSPAAPSSDKPMPSASTKDASRDAAKDDAPKPAAAPPVASGPASAPAKAPETSASPDAARAAKPAPGSFSVQLAAFSDDKGANALANRLKKSGHPAYTEPYSTARGTLWRVRVGPYTTREAAEAARAKLKADGQNGIIAAVN